MSTSLTESALIHQHDLRVASVCSPAVHTAREIRERNLCSPLQEDRALDSEELDSSPCCTCGRCFEENAFCLINIDQQLMQPD